MFGSYDTLVRTQSGLPLLPYREYKVNIFLLLFFGLLKPLSSFFLFFFFLKGPTDKLQEGNGNHVSHGHALDGTPHGNGPKG